MSTIRRTMWAAAALLLLVGCSKGATVAAPSTVPSSTTAPSSPPSAVVTEAPSTPTGATGTGGGGQAHYYDCATLLTDAEARQATGIPDMALFNRKGDDQKEAGGQTYCQFFGGGLSMAVSVFTGPSYSTIFLGLAQSVASTQNVPGVGDEAKWSEQGQTLGIRVGDIGITIAFAELDDGALPRIADLEGAAVAMGKLVASRV